MLIGWDWAEESHDVTVMDDDGGLVEHIAFAHTEEAFVELFTKLAHYGAPGELPVAIEASTGIVVDRLLEEGFPVVPIHPNAFAAARPRWGASRAKSDPGDSAKLADYLRTDGHRLRRLAPVNQATAELQALSRLRDDHVAARVAAINQLRALLRRYWPGAGVLFARLDSEIALAFLEDYPTPDAAARLGEGRMAMFCRRHGYSGRRSPADLVARLGAAPHAAAHLDLEVLTALVRAQVAQIRGLLTSIGALEGQMRAQVMAHHKAQLLQSLPRIGEINLAQVVAEVGPILDRAADAEEACSLVGGCPVTHASGKVKSVSFRWATNAKARQALSIFADNSRHSSLWAAELYASARARGKRHPHAIRILMRAWMRVIWACWTSDTAYDPEIHGSERRLVARLKRSMPRRG